MYIYYCICIKYMYTYHIFNVRRLYGVKKNYQYKLETDLINYIIVNLHKMGNVLKRGNINVYILRIYK